MDPSNTTPVEPNAAAAPAPSNEPAAPAAPEVPASAPGTPAVAPAAPAAPAAPVAPVAPVASAAPAAMPVNADVANAALNPPVNPVVAPTPNGSGAAVGGTMPMNQMFQAQPMTKADVFAETTAIAVPEGPKAPDPVEEELKAPLKAAGPVPGSIGSAVSMPAGATPAPDANNPMTATPTAPGTPQESVNPMAANAANPAAKKPSIFDKLTAKSKMDKKTLIILCAVAGVVLLILIVVLILVMTGAI